MRKPLDIFITVDTEASIGGCFTYPDKYLPLFEEPVDGMVAGQSEALGFLLRTLKRYQLTATFFTESLQARYFGVAPMQRRVHDIVAAGQDVQLHLHPCWLNFEDGKLKHKKQKDVCTKLPADELLAVFSEACQRFADWGIGKPIAVRTGNFSTGTDTFVASKAAGLSYSSNLAAGLRLSEEPALQYHHGFQSIAGMTELPLTSFGSYKINGKRTHRIMAIAACSSAEMLSALGQAYAQGLDAICILTHPFEFIRVDNFRYENMRVNRLTQGRFVRLCEFIANNSHQFQCQTFTGLSNKDIQFQVRPRKNVACSYAQMLVRATQNAAHDRLY